MDELIIRSLRGSLTPSEEAELNAWRQASLANERRYREVARIWSLTEAAAPKPSQVPTAAELLARRGRKAALPPPPQPVAAKEPVRVWPWAAAACLVLALAGTVTWIQEQGGTNTFAATEFVTGATETVAARLSDGSIVRLAPNSELRIMSDGPSREVWLDGHAFFAVAKQEQRPFTVRTRAGEALVLGTRFDVRVVEDSLRLVVVEGRVALAASGERVEIGAGQMSRVREGTPPAVETVEQMDSILDWMDGFLVFQATPLRDVAQEIERVYGIRVLVQDSTLADRAVTAWFSGRSAEEVLMVVCRVVDARCSIQDSVARIQP